MQSAVANFIDIMRRERIRVKQTTTGFVALQSKKEPLVREDAISPH
jgi:hypothetical protein